MDYLVPHAIWEACFVSALPKELPSFTSIYLPFDIVTWGLFVLTTIAAAFVLSLTEVMRSKVTKRENETIGHLVLEGEHSHYFFSDSYFTFLSLAITKLSKGVSLSDKTQNRAKFKHPFLLTDK